MSVYEDINVKVTGQVEYGDIKRKILAELELICARYDLELEEV